MPATCDFIFFAQDVCSNGKIRLLTMHNGTTFKVCRAHYDWWSERRAGVEVAAREIAERAYAPAPSHVPVWTFPAWESLAEVL